MHTFNYFQLSGNNENDSKDWQYQGNNMWVCKLKWRLKNILYSGKKYFFPQHLHIQYVIFYFVSLEIGTGSLKVNLVSVMATHSSILAWRIPMDWGTWWATVHGGHKKLDKTEQLSTHKWTESHHPPVILWSLNSK